MSLSKLPAEILKYILQSSNSLADALSLARASRQLYDVWRSNTCSICHVMLPQVIDCFESAMEALEAENYFESYKNPELQSSRTGAESAIQQAQKLLNLSRTVPAAVTYYLAYVNPKEDGHPLEHRFLGPTELPRFLRAYYGLRKYHYRSSLRLPTDVIEQRYSDLLSSTCNRDLDQQYHLAYWLMVFAERKTHCEMGLARYPGNGNMTRSNWRRSPHYRWICKVFQFMKAEVAKRFCEGSWDNGFWRMQFHLTGFSPFFDKYQ